MRSWIWLQALFVVTLSSALAWPLALARGLEAEHDDAYEVVRAFPHLTFEEPVYLTAPQDDTERIVVVERKGRVWVFANSPEVREKTLFLDLTDQVSTGTWEEGLLGMA